MDKLPPKRMVLKDKHPVMEKFNQLCALADDLGITLSFYGHRTHVEDADGNCFDVEDIENADVPMSDFPPCTEVRLVYDNPAYIALKEKERAEYRKVCEERDAAMKAAAEAKEAADKLEREQAKERQEREQYAKLKEKYGDARAEGHANES